MKGRSLFGLAGLRLVSCALVVCGVKAPDARQRFEFDGFVTRLTKPLRIPTLDTGGFALD